MRRRPFVERLRPDEDDDMEKMEKLSKLRGLPPMNLTARYHARLSQRDDGNLPLPKYSIGALIFCTAVSSQQ